MDTPPSLSQVRFPLRATSKHRITLPVIFVASTLYFAFMELPDLGEFLFGTAFVLLFTLGLWLFYEFAFRRKAYVQFHTVNFEVTTWQWMGHRGAPTENVMVPYTGITEVRVDPTGEIELVVNDVAPPLKLTDPGASVTFQPRDTRRVLDELYRRIEAVRVSQPQNPAPEGR